MTCIKNETPGSIDDYITFLDDLNRLAESARYALQGITVDGVSEQLPELATTKKLISSIYVAGVHHLFLQFDAWRGLPYTEQAAKEESQGSQQSQLEPTQPDELDPPPGFVVEEENGDGTDLRATFEEEGVLTGTPSKKRKLRLLRRGGV